jgi:hypothetical protein
LPDNLEDTGAFGVAILDPADRTVGMPTHDSAPPSTLGLRRVTILGAGDTKLLEWAGSGLLEFRRRRMVSGSSKCGGPAARATGAILNDLDRIRSITDRDRELNHFAFRSFRNIADGDYIAARMAHRAQLPTQFLWASQQALEKYLKCMLFIRRIPAKNLGHDLHRAVDLAEKNGMKLGLTEKTQKFISEIDGMGRYRYMEASLWVNWHWILSLDQAVWELRRFSTLHPTATTAKLVEGAWAPRVRIAGGHLETVIAKRDDPARAPLLWHNAFFGRGRRTVMVRGGFSSINSPLFQKADLLDEILKYVHIPTNVVKAYRENALKESRSG